MNLINLLKNLFYTRKRISIIDTKDLVKVKGEQSTLTIQLTNTENNPLNEREIIFTINGRDYTKITNEEGYASLNINLQPGEYIAGVRFNGDKDYKASTGYVRVIVNPLLHTDDLVMSEGDGGRFIATVTDINAKPIPNVPIKFSINGREYTKTTDENGEAGLNINLKQGDYEIKTSSIQSSIINKIHIDEPTPEPEPECSSPYTQRGIHLNQGAGYLGQKTGYYCAPHSVMQCIYDLTGIDLNEATLASVGGTTTSGTGHDGINTMIALI